MVALADSDKARVRWHLSYSDAVPDGDRAILEDRMSYLADNYTRSKVQELLDRCDRVLAGTEIDAQSGGVATKRILLGDVNRTDVAYSTENIKVREKAYIHETDRLALKLGVPNYTNPDWWGSRYFAIGSGRIPRIAAPVEIIQNIALGSDVYLYYA